ncbi:MAG: type II secretion system F family protein [Nanobdellota archaeon]
MKIGNRIYKILASRLPELEEKLRRAQMKDNASYFLKKIITVSIMTSVAVCLLFFAPILDSMGKSILPAVILMPVIAVVMFSYMSKIPDFYIIKTEKKVTKELMFALKFLLIELESGIQVYNAFKNIRKQYPVIGRFFGEVVDRVDYGKSIDEALNSVVKSCPSEKLKMIFAQVQNSMKTGADLATALGTTADQFTREQKIEVDEYSKKLNPIAMFYMIIAVIFPSIGFIMLIIISSFIGFQIDLKVLLMIVGAIGFMQFMFISMVKTIRPAVDF